MKRSLKRIALALFATVFPCLGWAAEATWTTVALPEANDATASATAFGCGSNQGRVAGAEALLEAGKAKEFNTISYSGNSSTVGTLEAGEGDWVEVKDDGDNTIGYGMRLVDRSGTAGTAAIIVPASSITADTKISRIRVKATICGSWAAGSNSGSWIAGTTATGTCAVGLGHVNSAGTMVVKTAAEGSGGNNVDTQITATLFYASAYTWTAQDKILLSFSVPSTVRGSKSYFIRVDELAYLTEDELAKMTVTRTVPGTDNNWSTASEWSSENAPATGENVELTVSGDATLTMDADSATLGGLTISGEGTLTFNGTGSLTATTTTIHADTDVSGITGTVNLGAVTIADGATLTAKFNQVSSITANNGIIRWMDAEPTVTASNFNGHVQYLGAADSAKQAITMNGAEVATNNGPLTTLDLGNVTVTNGTLDFGTATVNITGDVTLGESISKLRFGQASNAQTVVNHLAGTLSSNTSSTNSYIQFNGWAATSTYNLRGGELSAKLDFYMTGGPATINVSGGIFSSPINVTQNPGNVTINLSGTGTLATSIPNANVNLTTTGGTIAATSTMRIPQAIAVAEGNTLKIAVAENAEVTNLTFSGTISGLGTITKTNAGTLNLSAATFDTTSPSFTVEGGTLILPAGKETGATVTDGNLVLQLNAEQMAIGYTAQVANGVTVTFRDNNGEDITANAGTVDNNTFTPALNTWTPTNGNNWDTSENWTNGVPTKGTACIEVNGETTLVLSADTATLAALVITGEGSLNIEGNFKINAQNITVGTNTAINGVMISDSAPKIQILEGKELSITATSDVGKAAEFSGGGTLVKKGDKKFTLWANDSTEALVLNGVTLDVQAGTFEFNGYNKTPKTNNATIKIAGGTSVTNAVALTCDGATTIMVASGTGTAFTSGQTVTLNGKFTKSGAGTLTVPGTVTSANEVYLDEGTLKFTAAPNLTGNTHSDSGTTLEFTNGGTITNDANAFNGLLKVSGGTVTHNGAGRGLNSIEVAEGAMLISSSADGLNYNGTTTATISGTLHLEARWTIFAGNTFRVSGTLASDDNNFGNHYSAYDFYNHANNDDSHAKLYVVGPNARLTGRWGAHDSSKTLDVVFDTDDAKLTITKAPSANQHVTTMLDEGVDSGALAMDVAVTTSKTLTIAGGVALSGSGSWGGPVTLADGAILDATANAVAIGGAVTQSGNLKVKVASATEDATVLTCATSTFTPANISLVDAEGAAIEGFTVEANGDDTALVLVADAAPTVCTLDGNSYETLELALQAIADENYAGNGEIALTESVTLTETIQITKDVTIDLNGNTITYFGSEDDGVTGIPAIEVISGTLTLTTSNLSILETTDYVMALDNTILLSGGALVIDESVTVKTATTTAVSVTSGTIGGAGTLYGNLKLAHNTTIDATIGHLTIAGSGIVQFPEPVSDGAGGSVNSTVTFLMPDGLVYPQEIIKCVNADATHAKTVTLCVNDFVHNNYALTVMLDNQTGKVAAYGLAQHVCTGGHGESYTSVSEAIRVGEEEIYLSANTKEDITLPEGVTLRLASTVTGTQYKVVGNVTVKSGATLEPLGGDIEGNLILEDGAILSVYMEVLYPDVYEFCVSGTVTFPTTDLTIIAAAAGTAVNVGEPRQIIKVGTALTPGETVATTNLQVVSAAGQAASGVVKVISTSNTYEIVSVDSGNCTLDGVEYETIQQALDAYTATGDATLKLKSTPTLAETLVIDVDDPTTDEIEEITIDLNGYALDAILDNEAPTIRIESGDVWLISTAAEGEHRVSSTNATAIVVGAAETGAATENAALHIDESVTVMSAYAYAVDMVSGTLSGDATLMGNLNLQDGVTIDASAGALTMGSYYGMLQYNVTFPGTTGTAGTITVIPPVGATQATFIHCAGADAGNHANTNVQVVLTETAVSMDYEIIETYETVDETQIPTGYAVWVGKYAAATITSEGIEYHATFAAAVDAAGSTGTIILMSDLTLETDVTADIYTNGFDITTVGARTITGKLTITDGTAITLADTLTVAEVELVEYADAAVAGTITSTGDVTIKGTLSGMYIFDGNVVLTDGAGLTGSVSATSVTVSEGATVTINALLNTNLTVNNATVNGTGKIEIGEGKTLAGAGTINTTVILDDGATVDTCGYESNFLVLTALTALTEDVLITVKADTLSNVINAGTTPIATSNFTLTLADGSVYEAYNPGTPQALDTDAELLIPVVATRNGENLLGVVKLNYYIGGVQIADLTQGDSGVGVAKQLAAYGYRNGILEIKGVDTASSDPIEGYQLFTNVVNGFVGDYLVVTYDFGIKALNIVTVNATKHVIVTADVDGVNDKTEDDLSGNADYRTGTTVQLYTKVEGKEAEVTSAMGLDTAKSYGLVDDEATKLPPGVAYFAVSYDDLFTSKEAPPSETVKFTVKATNPGTNEEAWEGEE